MALNDWLDRYKPAASAKTLVLLAAAMWTAVGAVLVFFGARWTLGCGIPFVWLLLLLAAVAGMLKSRYVLERSADRALRRIRERGDGRCLGGFFSPKAWLFVVMMACLGRILRGWFAPRYFVGPLYVAVGTALLLAGRKLWTGWSRFDTMKTAC